MVRLVLFWKMTVLMAESASMQAPPPVIDCNSLLQLAVEGVSQNASTAAEASGGAKPVEEIAQAEIGVLEKMLGVMADINSMKKMELGVVDAAQGNATGERATITEEEASGAAVKSTHMVEHIVQSRVLGGQKRTGPWIHVAGQPWNNCSTVCASQSLECVEYTVPGEAEMAQMFKEAGIYGGQGCSSMELWHIGGVPAGDPMAWYRTVPPTDSRYGRCYYVQGGTFTCQAKRGNNDGNLCRCTGAAAEDPADQASVVGDPHVVSVAKAKFEIRAAGTHTLVQIPRFIRSNAEPDLRVDAEIHPLASHDCDKSFMTSMTVFGRWSEDAFGLLRISPGSDAPNTTLLVNTQRPEEFFKQFPRPDVKAGRESLSFKLRDVGVHVEKHFEGRYGKQRAYLNVRMSGLKKYEDLGGLLGYDSHADAEKPSADCAAPRPPAASPSSFIGSARAAPTTDGGSRIEAE